MRRAFPSDRGDWVSMLDGVRISRAWMVRHTPELLPSTPEDASVAPLLQHLSADDARLLESEIRLRASLARHDQDPSAPPEHLAGQT